VKFVLGMLAVLLLAGAIGAFLVHTGRLPIAATTPPDLVDRIAMTAKFEAVRRQGSGVEVTLPSDPASLVRGRAAYVESCLPCHGAPGVEPADFADGMNPKAPPIEGDLQVYTDGQLFWVIKNGVRATGMPAFAANLTDEEIAAVTAFVRRTPRLTPEERKEVAALAAGGE
jgi:mono/diheme cytochrome c family protein